MRSFLIGLLVAGAATGLVMTGLVPGVPTLFTTFATDTTAERCAAPGFKWGIGIAPYGLNDRDGSLLHDPSIARPVLDEAKALGVQWVRIGIPDWVMARQDELMVPVIDYANELGLNVVLGFDPPEGNPTKVVGNAALSGQTWGQQVAQRYAGKVCYYQLSNEISGQVMKPGWPGLTSESIDQARYAQVRNWLRGASTSVQTYDPKAKIVLTGHWLGVAIFEQLVRDQVPFDAIGWDWFGEQTNLRKIPHDGATVDLPALLKPLGKELWITEADYSTGSQTGEAIQARFFEQFAPAIRSDSAFAGFFPFLLNDTIPIEVEYGGLVRPVYANAQWTLSHRKSAFFSYQAIVQKE